MSRSPLLSLVVAAALVAPLAAGPAAAADGLRIASWNVKHLGWADDKKDYAALATVLENFDLVGLQEVMDLQAVDRLVHMLETRTHEAWGTIRSHEIGRGSYKEAYVFLWRESRVNYLDGAVVYLDPGDRFAREPLSARFQTEAGDLTVVLANVHVLYGDSRKDREAEARALADYWAWLEEVYPDTPNKLLMGDFNLDPRDNDFQPLARFATPLFVDVNTTLGDRDGRYVSPYDNIWMDRDATMTVLGGDRLDYPDLLDITHEVARDTVSDHAPVWAEMTP